MHQHLPAHLPIPGVPVISPDLPSPVLPSPQLMGLLPLQPAGPGPVTAELRSPQTSFLTSKHKKCGGLCSWGWHNLHTEWETSELWDGLVTVRGAEGHGSVRVQAGSHIQLRSVILLSLTDCWEHQRQFTRWDLDASKSHRWLTRHARVWPFIYYFERVWVWWGSGVLPHKCFSNSFWWALKIKDTICLCKTYCFPDQTWLCAQQDQTAW